MNYPILEDLLPKADCKYTLVVLAAKRAREIIKGSEILVDHKSLKPVSIALEEIAQGKITYERTKNGIK
ncbi:DNA-directed RNA polymerase subunit omega [Sporomusa silvacetica DSM 10669]|uniref:DNA-directed RNA polymerase subunit omega n=1 Tax=Sporomusa silvacetica DSM 10669 TaxID=1123289 RepID=A0ABZ3IKD4_9FIRM|nr:DNA-directed RNA polymerase subunit omega [Sporomusa silvacetica]OZC13565.1 DNA-directed RNA polymerase subunit omega [Sporomusa silvacetica DSM 10669]